MAASKLTLELDYDFDFYLLGIRSDLSDYRLAYGLNGHLEIQLKRGEHNLELEAGKGESPIEFTIYEFEEPEMDRDWFLVSNRGSQLIQSQDQGLFSGQDETYRTDFLLPELKTFDYLLVVHGLLGHQQEERLQKMVREVTGIQAQKDVDPEHLRHRDRLLFLDQ